MSRRTCFAWQEVITGDYMATLTELQSFADRTSFDIPFIDYQVGVSSSITTFTNYRTLPSSGAAITYNASNNSVYVTGNNLVVSGFDFSGTTVIVSGNNVTVRNNKFDAIYGYYALTQSTGFSGLVVDHNTFDGLKLDKDYARFINSGVNKITITYNQFLNAPSDAVALMNGVVDHNYFSGAGYQTDAHADAVWVPHTTGPVQITNNFIDSRKTVDAIVSPNTTVMVNNEFGDTHNVTVNGNVLLGGSYTVDVSDKIGLPIDTVSVSNNFIASGLYGDLYPINQPADLVFRNNNAVTISASIGPTLIPYVGQTIIGTAGLVGEILQGTGGGDHIFGHGNSDRIIGAGGRDIIFGGVGADAFIYQAVSDSTAGQTDIISDFEDGLDKIDISALGTDAAGKTVAQSFIGSAAFSGRAGEVHQVQSGNSTWVELDVDGNKTADLRVELLGTHSLTSANFVLAPATLTPPVVTPPIVTPTVPTKPGVQPTVSTDASGNLLVIGTAGASGQVLTGGAGADHIFGNGQNDQIIGGGGRDALFGGKGADIFVYRSVNDSLADSGDVIADFEDGLDKIDLSALASAGTSLTFTGSAAFSGSKGEVHTVQASNSTFVEIDLDGDKKADMRMQLFGAHSLTGANFVLGGTSVPPTPVVTPPVVVPPPVVVTPVSLPDAGRLVQGTFGRVGETLAGGTGADHVFGHGDQDRIIGGGGRDSLFGGKGADFFVYQSVSDSLADSGDVIADFEDGLDKFDLHALGTASAPLSFLGSQAFNGAAGSIHAVQSGASTFIEADLNGDKSADFRIELLGVHRLSASNFLL